VENISTLEARGINWWKSTLLNHIRNIPEQQSPAHILVVSHGAFIATLVKGLLGARHIGQDAPGFKISRCLNTAICEIEVDDTLKGKLVKWGDIEHLLKPVVESNPDE
jgi:probable phosphoglycerate mutase